ncbi:TPA: LysR family transcriptional regulator [Klebsiella pneumoniae]|nr:LysR family transcriptional regulator [Klebsiella pneumoniae]HBQ8850865.1 LysR family transcriptional regulator [Klebsiella pneumoniae]
MDKLDTLTLFVRIVERGSFSAAAADLGVSRPVATAAIKALEVSLGARLLHRTTRHVRPTAEGSLYYQRCVSILAALEEANRSAGGSISGTIRVDVAGNLARTLLLPALPQFLARYGTPHTIEGLTGHVMIGFVSSRTQRTLPLSFTQDGRQSEVSLPCRLLTSDADVGAEAARLGFGLYQAPLPRLEADLASGALTEVLADFRPAPLPLSLLYPSNRQLSARVQVFIDWVTALMKPPLAQQASGRLK